MMVTGSLCAVLHGSAQPLMLLVFGLLTDTFIEYDIELNELRDDRKECVNNTIQWKKNYTVGLTQPLNQSNWFFVNNSTLEMLVPLEQRSCGYVGHEGHVRPCGWVLPVNVIHCNLLLYSILDIEYEMTQFAFYYVGIGAAVFLLGYFQVIPFPTVTSDGLEISTLVPVIGWQSCFISNRSLCG